MALGRWEFHSPDDVDALEGRPLASCSPDRLSILLTFKMLLPKVQPRTIGSQVQIPTRQLLI